MGLFDKLRGEFIDIIEWLDDDRDVIVYRFERYQNEIKNGAKLTVRQGQAAVFVNEGQIADVFQPGMHTLNTANLPILSTLKGWKYGFDSPFKAEVYFVNTRKFTGMKWGTPAPITLNDDRYGFVEIRAFGTYELQVSDPGKFLTEVVGTDGEFTTDEITDQVRSIVVREFTDGIGEANLPIEAYAGNIKELGEAATAALNEDMHRFGLDIPQFYIENVNMPDEVKKEIFEYSRLNKIDLNKLAQMKAAKAMEAAAANPGGDAGAGIGMGMGFAMAQQFGN
ncbi:MAG TPA: antifreeze protein, partial [Cytophagales bacterium]|nr:antifreeze protein [Cytophagales bacterium]